MSYVFLVPENSIRGLKNVISGHLAVHFRWNFHRKIVFKTFFIAPKDSILKFREGRSLELFFNLLYDFGSLLTALTVTVKALWKSVSRLMRRASFFETSFYYTRFDFLQFLGVLTFGYIICILLLYLTNMVSYFWISSADLIGPNRHSISLVI